MQYARFSFCLTIYEPERSLTSLDHRYIFNILDRLPQYPTISIILTLTYSLASYSLGNNRSKPGYSLPAQRGLQPPPHRSKHGGNGRIQQTYSPRSLLLRNLRKGYSQKIRKLQCKQLRGHVLPIHILRLPWRNYFSQGISLLLLHSNILSDFTNSEYLLYTSNHSNAKPFQNNLWLEFEPSLFRFWSEFS